MTPTAALLDAMVALLADDPGTLAPAALANHVHLAKAPFTPGAGLTLGDLTEADFDGYTALDAGVGTQQVFEDPVTGLRTIQLLEPAGGWTWITTGVTNLPQTIYGAYLTDNADAVLLGSVHFDSPVLLTAASQAILQGNIQLRFATSSPY